MNMDVTEFDLKRFSVSCICNKMETKWHFWL